MIFLTEQDKEWLAQNYQGLKIGEGGISGVCEFTATYNRQKNEFFLTEEPGVKLSGRFQIKIQERPNSYVSKLPALYVEEVDHIANRHFNPSDNSACLCSPLEEDAFLEPEFQLSYFIEHLVIPFLYCQEFYSKNNRWPWTAYEHGAIGMLESYGKIKNPDKIKDCLLKLSQEPKVWFQVRVELLRKGYIKGGLPCFCEIKDHRRRCHPDALAGIRQLKNDINKHNLIWYVEEINTMVENYKKGIRPFNSLTPPSRPSIQAAPQYTAVSNFSRD